MILSSGLLWAACDDDYHSTVPDSGATTVDPGAHQTTPLDGGARMIDAGFCEQKLATFIAFLAEHSSCTVDSDCTIIGDCCPHADFAAVRSDVVGQARALQLESCSRSCDGATYAAVCVQGKCERKQNPMDQWCGAPHPRDGGR
ncbi:MAG: hypothetical protein JWN04_5667 [Myxococcaceae bacterium]|nr:hypothetical protein [Myxococcaceae bacterium]